MALSNPADSDDFIGRITAWFAKPLVGNANAVVIFLATGIVLIAAYFWTRVLRHVQDI